MDPELIWILVGLVLLGLETLLPGVYLLWIGMAAIGTGLVAMATQMDFAADVAVFLVLLAAAIGSALRLRRSRHPRPVVNTPDAGLVGRHGIVIPAEGPGLRVRLGDSDWPARLARGVETAAAGTTVRIEGVDGTTLIIRPE
jgi:membrane protein implicated in regulation of membrane protease activity